MATYLVIQILAGRLDYEVVVKRFPQYKEEIDEQLGYRWLRDHGYA